MVPSSFLLAAVLHIRMYVTHRTHHKGLGASSEDRRCRLGKYSRGSCRMVCEHLEGRNKSALVAVVAKVGKAVCHGRGFIILIIHVDEMLNRNFRECDQYAQ